MKAVPDTWHRTILGNLCSFESGTGFGPADWTTSGLPIIRIQNLNGSNDFNYYSGDANPSWIVEPGELLFAWAGVKGVSFGPTIWRGARGVLNQHIYRIRPAVGVELEWLYLLLMHVTASIEASAHGFKNNLVHVRKADITGQVCFKPPLWEQQAIANVMSTWDRGIRLLSDLIAAKLRFKQGLMHQLLTGKLRLRPDGHNGSRTASDESTITLGLTATAIEVERGVINGKSYDEGIPALDECPSGWQTRKLRELLTEVQRPLTLQCDKTYQLVTAKRYRAGIVPREVLRGDQIKTSTQFQTTKGDFLISRRQIVHGACGLVPSSLDGAIVSNEYSCLRVCDELDPLFLEYLTHTKYLQRTFYQSSVGVTVEKMIFRLDHWLKYDIHLPPVSEQRRIVTLLSATDQEIVVLDRQQRILSEQKKGLMQKLLSGQVRVKLPIGGA